jgi:hypothetical protein
MTKLLDPCLARVFIVGMNQAKTYSERQIGSHEEYIAALFNRAPHSCRGLYDKVTGGQPSPTRHNIDDLTRRLEVRGVKEVLETNVICYGTPMSGDLSRVEHHGGRARGEGLFRFLLSEINPDVIIVHGASAARRLAKTLQCGLPPEPSEPVHVPQVRCEMAGRTATVFVTKSLAPPRWMSWKAWAPEHFDHLADAVAIEIRTRS